MIPLIAILAVFTVLFLINEFVAKGKVSSSFAGRCALATMMCLAGVAHFVVAEPMVQMMPEFIPAKFEIVYLTGICELIAAVGLLFQRTARLTGITLIIFFIAIFPANVAGSVNAVQFGGMESGAVHLFFRAPLQIFFIFWTWIFAVISVRK